VTATAGTNVTTGSVRSRQAFAGLGFESIESASRDELTALQLERLKWSVGHAYRNVEHYRNVFDQAGAHPDDIRQLTDLARFPLLAKSDLRDHYPFGLFAVPREQVARIHASSGTTGKPTVVGYTRKDIDTWAGLVARSIYAAGGRPGQIVHVAYGYGLFTGGLGAHYGAERLGCSVVPMSGGQTEKQVQLILDFRPHVIMVTPSYMLTIAEEFERQGFDAQGCSLKVGIFGAEPWTGAMRNEIERRMGIDALDIYGLSEVMGPGVACECVESKDGLTLWEDHFYPEIIDPDTGAVLPDGEEGELVLTSLTKEAFPVIRYRTRDRTRLLPPTARTMRRLGRINGRTDDMLIIRGVNVFPSQIEEIILGDRVFAPNYLLEVDRESHLDTLTVQVEWPAGGASGCVTREAAARDLVHHIKSRVGISTRVRVADPGTLERSVGKARRVVDRRRP
jgi:phenylacetate-CoA ligase